MKHTYSLLVVILNYKTARLLIDCLESLVPEITEEQGVVIVDNHSGDDSVHIFKDWISNYKGSNVHLLESKANTGFSGGNNLGIGFADAEYYLLLNSDTIVLPGAISRLLVSAANNNDAGLVSPRLEWPDTRAQVSCFNYHSPISEFINAASTGLFTSIFKSWDIPLPLQNITTFPQWTSFACVLIKREVFDDVGPMDDSFFLYYEDVDFCRVARNNGWKILNDPEAKVVHLRGGSSDVKTNTKNRKRLPRYLYLSRSRYFAKHYGRLGLLLANIFWTSGRFVSLIREMFGKKGTPVVERQHLDIWIGFSNPHQKYRPRE